MLFEDLGLWIISFKISMRLRVTQTCHSVAATAQNELIPFVQGHRKSSLLSIRWGGLPETA